MDSNWLTPKARPKQLGDKGWGSIAAEPIARGETVAGFGGWVVTREVLAGFDEERQGRSLQIDDDLYLMSGPERENGDMVNHSCDPNCGMSGNMLLVAMRDIEVGEELTFDYAMCDASDYDEFTCLCGASACRGVVTGSDWRDPQVQSKYLGYFSPYLVKRITALTTH